MTDDSGRTLERPVLYSHISQQAEDVLALWKTSYKYTERLRYQGAHQSLIEQMEAVSKSLGEACNRLTYLRDFFPDDESLES